MELLFLTLFPVQKSMKESKPALVCNKPYILVGADCCLDRDNNSICDVDETTISIMITTTSIVDKITTIPTTTSTMGAIECNTNADCGINGKKIVKYYTCLPTLNENIYRRYIEYSCRNPGLHPPNVLDLKSQKLLRPVKMEILVLKVLLIVWL